MPAQLLLLASALSSSAGLEPSPGPSPSVSASSGEIAPTERKASSPIEAAPSTVPVTTAPASDDVEPTTSNRTDVAVPPSERTTPASASHDHDHDRDHDRDHDHDHDHDHDRDHDHDHDHDRSHGNLWDPPKRPLSRRQRAGKAPISVRLKTLGELGSLNVLAHSLQLGKNGTELDLQRDGRQDTMFFFRRLSAELEIDDHHQIILLYQPISFNTQTVLMEDLVADDVTFPAMSGLSIFYGFDIYRLSYAYDFFTDPEQELAVGFSMQVRNFRQSYVSSDGEHSVTNTNIGAVPIIKVRGRHQLKRANFWYGGELDGFYANIPYINGGDDPVEGLIVDASLRAGVTIAKVVRPFANLRYIGGGGKGTSSDKVGFGDGYSSNWLHTIAFSLGAEVTIPAVVGDRKARDREIAARKARRKARR